MSFDAIVVGAGIVGACTANALVGRGLEVALLEADGPGQGITRWCPGGVRQQWGTDLNVTLVRDSLPFFRSVSELHPRLEFEESGYLFVTHTEEGVEHMRQLVVRQNRLGVPARLIFEDDIRELIPHLAPDSVLAGSFGPTDGFVNDAALVARTLVERLESQGMAVRLSRATALRLAGDRVNGVETEFGAIEAPLVIVAAGHGSRDLLAAVGTELPVGAEERRLHYTTAPAAPDFLQPFVASLEQRWAGKQLEGGFYMSYLGELPEGDEEFIELTYRQGERVVTGLRELHTERVVHGVYASTPDHQAIVDRAPQVEGLWLATGFSGHGFMMAPAVGEALAQLALDEERTYDLSEYRLARFESDTPLRDESQVI